MIAKDCGRKVVKGLAALTVLGSASLAPVWGQGFKGKTAGKGRAATATADAPAQTADAPAPKLALTAIPVNPTDPIAIVNNEVISRQRLADEAVARKGEEILETLIARTLIEQALKASKMEVTAAEIDAEIDNVAMKIGGLGREAWLKSLEKDRGISPMQYARDIIYPALALRKLAAPQVEVTPIDLKNSFEALYGAKLRCRIIMVDKERTAIEIWEELRKNPGGFEKIAMDRSMDSSSRSLGGLMAEPISRHAYPTTVSDAAFAQLVDGDSNDNDASHKPKDGSFTGPIQVDQATWILLRRESVIPASKADPNDPRVKKEVHDMIYDVRLKEGMGRYMNDLMQRASIDNKLTGRVKLANETGLDKDVKLMSGRPTNAAPKGTAAGAPSGKPTAAGRARTPTPAGLSSDAVQQAAAARAKAAAAK